MASGTVAVEIEGPEAEFGPVEFNDENTARTEPVSSAQVVEKPDRLSDPTEAKKGPPTLNEWQDFFSRFVVKLIIDAYLFFALGDLLDELTPMELQQIMLTKDDMKEMAAPFATMANRSSLAKKHGRTIIGFADSYESILNFLFWMRRVNRVAKKHGGKPKRQPKQRANQRINQGVNNAGHDGTSSDESRPAPANGVIFNPNFG